MKIINLFVVLISLFLISCAAKPNAVIEDGVSITTVSLVDRDLILVESLDRSQAFINLRCGGLVTAGFCDKCVRGQIRDMEQNKPVRDCRNACKTDNCTLSAPENLKVFVARD